MRRFYAKCYKALQAMAITIAGCALWPSAAYADGTQAGTNVEISFSLDYDVEGVAQTTIDTGPSGSDTPVEFTVDRRIDLTVASSGNVTVNPEAQDQDLVFTLSNDGNDTQAYELSVVNEGGDDFSATNVTLFYYVDDGDEIFEPGSDDGAAIAYNGSETPDLALGRVLFIVAQADIPAAVNDGDEDQISLVADTLEPTTAASPGTEVMPDVDGINQQLGAAENVLSDGSGTANENANEGDHSASASYVVESPLVVTSTDDSGVGSLREAITFANDNAESDAIIFNISGSGPHVISLLSALPIITDANVSVDASTQMGAVCNSLWDGNGHVLKLHLDGTNAGSAHALETTADGTTFRGFSITNFRRQALRGATGATNMIVDCNYVGVAPDGSTAGSNGTNSGIGSVVRVMSDGATISRNVISGNDDDTDINSVNVSASQVSIIGNFMGTNPEGVNAIGNAEGIIIGAGSHSNIIIGGSGEDGNLISGQVVGSGIHILSSGGTLVKGNLIGLNRTGTLPLANNAHGVFLDAAAADIVIGGAAEADRNIISGNNATGITVTDVDAVDILGNYIGLAADGNTGIENSGAGIVINNSTGVNIGDGTALGSNIIARNAGDGIQVNGNDAEVTIIANAIHNNDGLGIDLRGATGRDINDGGDLDDGPNDLLNFPVINDFASDGNTAVTYDINLDVPAADYRIDFYKNTVVDVSGYGEGEIHLGFDEFTHSGGNAQHTGALTSNAVVTQGDNISATTTRKTAPSTYDITSEFSLSTITGSPTELIASKSVDVYDPTSAGLYALPGNDVVSSLTITNPGTAPADADTIVIIDLISTEVEFYNGDVDGGGPQSNAVGFVQSSGAGMTFTYVSDVKYSNSGTRPANMGACNYSPAIGYDDNVTFICINPKGALAAGDPDPNFTVSYRTRIK